jgi:hypothetical protein
MAAKPLPSPELLRQLLRYEPETGKLFWRERSSDLFPLNARRTQSANAKWWNQLNAGQIAGKYDCEGYVRISVFGRSLASHRIVWAMHCDEWPLMEIDHIDGNRSNNRTANLRLVDKSQNAKNRKLGKLNTSGIIGVTWNRSCAKWQSQIRVSGRTIYLGVYSSKIEAAMVRKCAENKHGFSPIHGQNRTKNSDYFI